MTNKMTKIGYAIQLRCTQGHKFFLIVEREDDLQESFTLAVDAGLEIGYVVYRDRSFVHCGYCQELCYFTGVRAKTEIIYTPPSREERANER